MRVIVNNQEIKLVIANNFLKKLKGFMFNQEINYCLRLKTNNVHTFFMKKNLDIVMTDKNNNVLYVFKNVKKNKIIIKPKAYFTYEFPSGFINNLKTGEKLNIIN